MLISESMELENISLKIKSPSRILHFSDGIMEEFSDEEVEEVADLAPALPVDEVCESSYIFVLFGLISSYFQSQMAWGEWLALKAVSTGTNVLEKCDTAGEFLAWFLGITTPKFSYEIELYKRMQAEDARLAQEDKESASWSEVSQLEAGVIKESPKATNCAAEVPVKY